MSSYLPQMKLTEKEQEILQGKEGPVKSKMMESLVRYGDMFHAKRMVPLTHKEGHLVISFGLSLIQPVYDILDEIIKSGIVAEAGFTMNPRPLDFQNIKVNPVQKIFFKKIMYPKQKELEKRMIRLGVRDKDDYTCTSYLPEVGNLPKEGDILSWSESSAVSYVNSVLGARCNRNSGLLDLFSTLLGITPEFGLLTDEGRKADYIIKVETSSLPDASLLGSTVGMKVMEKVPYLYGLEKYLKPGEEKTLAYLKNFGAAAATNGAVGLYHVNGITPEAQREKEALIHPDAKVYVIDDKELSRIYQSYPNLWKKKDKKAKRCFIGCPHLTLGELKEWGEKILQGLKETQRKKVTVPTVLLGAPQVVAEFQKTKTWENLKKTGVTLSSICPLTFISNPLVNSENNMTNSNKLRGYSKARYFTSEDTLSILIGRRKI